MNWIECTEEFNSYCDSLETFSISNTIKLLDSIAAIEMMDFKMDYFTALADHEAPILNQDNGICLFLHFLCGQSLTTCYYPHQHLTAVVQELRKYGLYEEEEIVSHDCSIICKHGNAYNDHLKLDNLALDILQMMKGESAPQFQLKIKPDNFPSSAHHFLWASKITSTKCKSKEIPFDVNLNELPEMLLSPPRPFHLIPNNRIEPIYNFMYKFYNDIHSSYSLPAEFGLNLYWRNFFYSIGSCYFSEVGVKLFNTYDIDIDGIEKSQIPLDFLFSTRNHVLMRDKKIQGHPINDFFLLQLREISHTIATHSKEEIQKLGSAEIPWPPMHLHDLLSNLLPGLNSVFGDLIHSSAHNSGRYRRMLNGYIESIKKIPFDQYDDLLSKMLRDVLNTYLEA
eukprot:NODE_15_length_50561_cov_0.608081.p13 type:complete len:396 gc:universal NODE_15_length_50561_cov_0.608081:47945-46758(-)